MTDDETPTEPDWTRRCKPFDLDELHGAPYMLRASDDPDSPWRSVKTRREGFWTDRETGARFEYVSFDFWHDDTERLVNIDDEIEVGLVRPPWWTDDMAPPEWPRKP